MARRLWLLAGAAVLAIGLAIPSLNPHGGVAEAQRRGVRNATKGQRGGGRESKDNLRLLTLAVKGEARGEPYEGKVAVAAVILNRTEHPGFPNSVAGIVYQPGAFESVSNGEVYRGTCADCGRAARDALNGWDPSNGSIYFFAPDKTKNKFIWSRPQVRRIGKHIFAK